MANSGLFLDSMRELSIALEKAMALTQSRSDIRGEFDRIQAAPENDSKVLWNTVLESMPKISMLREMEMTLQNDYLNHLRNSVRIALEYLLTFEESDLKEPSGDGPQKHLQLLYDVVTSRYTSEEERISVDQGLAAQVLDKLESYSRLPKAVIIKGLIDKILANCNYVG